MERPRRSVNIASSTLHAHNFIALDDCDMVNFNIFVYSVENISKFSSLFKRIGSRYYARVRECSNEQESQTCNHCNTVERVDNSLA